MLHHWLLEKKHQKMEVSFWKYKKRLIKQLNGRPAENMIVMVLTNKSMEAKLNYITMSWGKDANLGWGIPRV